MAEFSEGATTEVARLQGLLAAADAAYADLVVYFGVPAKKKAPDSRELFTTLHEFVEAFRAAVPKPKPPPKPRRAGSVVSTKEGGSPAASARPRYMARGSTCGSLCGSVKSTEEGGGEEEAGPELDPMLSKIQMLKAGGAVTPAARATATASAAARRLRLRRAAPSGAAVADPEIQKRSRLGSSARAPSRRRRRQPNRQADTLL